MDLETNKIKDLDMYLTCMQKPMLDKIFFIDKVFEPFTYIVDFGCANGDLIKLIKKLFNEYRCVGYDISAQMIEAARLSIPDADFYTDWDSIDVPFSDSLLNISSVIHEVYSYDTPEGIALFWSRVFDSGFRYITIRDMSVSDSMDVPADPVMIDKVRACAAYRDHLSDYERVWGRIDSKHRLIHYLLKYSYTHNWEREVREDYLGLSSERLEALVPDNYRIAYAEHFTLPYLQWAARRDFGIELNEHTHIKMILERKD